MSQLVQLAIHKVHRRLAEICDAVQRRGGFSQLTDLEQRDLHHCLIVNADFIRKVDDLRTLSLAASLVGDKAWQHDICQKIDELSAKCQ